MTATQDTTQCAQGTSQAAPAAAQPPARPLIKTFWAIHRALYRFTGGRVGLRAP